MSHTTTGAVMVVGGGIAGIQASLDLAESGYKVYLVESNSAIGGKMAQLDKTFPTNDCSMCIISPKLVEAGRHLNIELLPLTEVDLRSSGEPGRLHASPAPKNRASSTWPNARPAANAPRSAPSRCPIFSTNACGAQGGLQTLSPGHARRLCHRKARHGPLQGGLPGACQRAGLDRPDEPGPLCRCHGTVQKGAPLPRYLRAGVPSSLRGRLHPQPARSAPGHQYLHRFLADWDMQRQKPIFPRKRPPKTRRSPSSARGRPA
jgi:hypothetical protein